MSQEHSTQSFNSAQDRRAPRSLFLLAVHPARAILEAWAVGLLLLFLLSRLVGRVAAPVLANGLLVLCGVVGIWVVLRARLPTGSWRQQLLREVCVSVGLGLGMLLGLLEFPTLLGWEAVWEQSGLRNALTFALLLAGLGPGYFVTRGVVRLWLYWNRLRRLR